MIVLTKKKYKKLKSDLIDYRQIAANISDKKLEGALSFEIWRFFNNYITGKNKHWYYTEKQKEFNSIIENFIKLKVEEFINNSDIIVKIVKNIKGAQLK
jgi:hypothetical protein